MRLPFFIGILIISCCVLTPTASAKWYSQNGVTSNLFIEHGRVIFCQADGSLTQLDLHTGRVLLRDKGNWKVTKDGDILKNGKTAWSGKGYQSVNYLDTDENGEECSECGVCYTVDNRTVNFYTKNSEGAPTWIQDYHAATFKVCFHSSSTEWQGMFTAILPFEEIVSVAISNGILVYGTNSGRVEAIDIHTGRSRWLYLFPSIQLQFPSDRPWHFQLQYIDQQVKTYQASYSRLRKTMPMQIAGSLSAAPIVFDPKPYDMAIGYWIMVAVITALTILGILIVYRLIYRLRRRVSERAPMVTASTTLLIILMFFSLAGINPLISLVELLLCIVLLITIIALSREAICWHRYGHVSISAVIVLITAFLLALIIH